MFICPKCLATYYLQARCKDCGHPVLKDGDAMSGEDWLELNEKVEQTMQELKNRV